MDNFQQRKKDILNKIDKSSIGKWDEKIKEICDKINSFENYYTTSSCSGRIIIMKDEEKKSPGLFEFVSHDIVEFENINKELEKISGNSKFKSEPPILHVACKTLENAEKLLKMAQNSGWKRSGIISLGRNIVVEILSTEKLEFPIISDGELLVDETFLKIVLEKANENLRRGWRVISRLGKEIEKMEMVL